MTWLETLKEAMNVPNIGLSFTDRVLFVARKYIAMRSLRHYRTQLAQVTIRIGYQE